jgi:hypothetical protein
MSDDMRTMLQEEAELFASFAKEAHYTRLIATGRVIDAMTVLVLARHLTLGEEDKQWLRGIIRTAIAEQYRGNAA